MSTTAGSQRRAECREWRERGLSQRAIAELYGMSEFTVQKWLKGIPAPEGHPRRVGYHPYNRCWHIYYYECRKSGLADRDPEIGIDWWPEEWERFATKEAAEVRLKAKEGPCSTTA